jgi:hypothetical protein
LTYTNTRTRFPVSVYYHDLDLKTATEMKSLLESPLYGFRTSLEKIPDGYRPYLRKNREGFRRRPMESSDY